MLIWYICLFILVIGISDVFISFIDKHLNWFTGIIKACFLLAVLIFFSTLWLGWFYWGTYIISTVLMICKDSTFVRKLCNSLHNSMIFSVEFLIGLVPLVNNIDVSTNENTYLLLIGYSIITILCILYVVLDYHLNFRHSKN